NSRWGVAEAVLRCAAKHEELQEPVLKELRRYFRAEKASNKLNFINNVITLNSYDGANLKMERCDLHGCLLMEILLSFKKIKTLRACFEALSPEDIVRLAKNNRTSHVLQAAFKSSTLGDDIKEKLIAPFESDWGSLISDVYGSHVFETIWDCSLFNVNRRQTLMKKLVPIHITENLGVVFRNGIFFCNDKELAVHCIHQYWFFPVVPTAYFFYYPDTFLTETGKMRNFRPQEWCRSIAIGICTISTSGEVHSFQMTCD
ncbi:unnamed protein product, partial [Strongylus vulgaris]